jgi:hypothetical protein
VPRGDLRFRYHANNRGLLGHLYCGVLLYWWRSVRERREQRRPVQHGAAGVHGRVLLSRGRDERDRRWDGRPVHRGVLLPRERDDGYRRRDWRHMQRGVLLPHELRVRQRRN